MTIAIYDGRHLLMDRVTTTAFPLYHGGSPISDKLDAYYESSGKIYGTDKPVKGKSFGIGIRAWSMLGLVKRNMAHFLDDETNDIKMLHQINCSFPNSNILNTETTYLFIDDTGSLIYQEADEKQDIQFYEHKPEDFTGEKACIVFGCNNLLVKSLRPLMPIDKPMTAIECMVYAQGTTHILGRTFDMLDCQTGKLTMRIDLSDRVREKVLAGVKDRIQMKHLVEQHPTYRQLTGVSDA